MFMGATGDTRVNTACIYFDYARNMIAAQGNALISTI